MATERLLGLAAVSNLADVVPRRRRWWQRAMEPENAIRIVGYGAGVGLAVFAVKKLYDRLRRPIEEGNEQAPEEAPAETTEEASEEGSEEPTKQD